MPTPLYTKEIKINNKINDFYSFQENNCNFLLFGMIDTFSNYA